MDYDAQYDPHDRRRCAERNWPPRVGKDMTQAERDEVFGAFNTPKQEVVHESINGTADAPRAGAHETHG